MYFSRNSCDFGEVNEHTRKGDVSPIKSFKASLITDVIKDRPVEHKSSLSQVMSKQTSLVRKDILICDDNPFNC